ncbi:universal stress protein [Nocardioides albus]|uniref:Nucleotide-binding universal stress UspA family protein n=1 Tax=Nocardioides albus TaxID=1841 RepID=A0A7W5A330_9ACTN|nr:universal stress protein [Nocardioides albus]MBB3088379.1 nucleotide-binding universal stress UspA family protein [Nocardioides albus]GGU15882.1 universal stress protein [Nocardioides albus]
MTILIGYVPTPVGEAALEAGLAEAAARGDDVIIINSPRRGATVDADLVDETTAAELVARATAAGVTARVDHTTHGADIVETFEALVDSTGARLIVIGLRRRSPVGKALLGSDAQRILLDARVPVLAVKPTA